MASDLSCWDTSRVINRLGELVYSARLADHDPGDEDQRAR